MSAPGSTGVLPIALQAVCGVQVSRSATLQSIASLARSVPMAGRHTGGCSKLANDIEMPTWAISSGQKVET